MAKSDLKALRSFTITLFVLAAISAFILLVDKYLAGTVFWWIVVILSCGGYLYMRIVRDLNWSPFNVGKPQVAQPSDMPSDLTTILTDPETGRSFSLTNVTKIEVETTGGGPFDEDLYWIFHLQSKPRVRMAGGVAQGLGIFDVLKQFDGVNFEKVIQSASTVTPAMFLIWEKT